MPVILTIKASYKKGCPADPVKRLNAFWDLYRAIGDVEFQTEAAAQAFVEQIDPSIFEWFDVIINIVPV